MFVIVQWTVLVCCRLLVPPLHYNTPLKLKVNVAYDIITLQFTFYVIFYFYFTFYIFNISVSLHTCLLCPRCPYMVYVYCIQYWIDFTIDKPLTTAAQETCWSPTWESTCPQNRSFIRCLDTWPGVTKSLLIWGKDNSIVCNVCNFPYRYQCI